MCHSTNPDVAQYQLQLLSTLSQVIVFQNLNYGGAKKNEGKHDEYGRPTGNHH
jgi:hypothetical protein